ncbi:hypothetical protein [Spirochaeta isovalerica]|uniref:Lipoprotein n=1 Tax=Spirochaeta isovalerica TaxID=150 RepID=A0A841RCZ4_9SPIO|nr:hypothetical protein [Spirochaeta isovalerica]MBB6481107.1 hypothetical protein [Spirochaeta isovalerica]
MKKAVSLIFFTLLLGSCASMMTMNDHYKEMDDLLLKRDFPRAEMIIKEAKEEGKYVEKDKVLYYLDIGMLNYYNGSYSESIENLSAAEYGIEELYTKSVGKAIASGLLNDNALDYFGEDYEDIYLNIFKALSFLHLGNYDEAMVELRRINIKLNLLEDKYRKIIDEYNNSDEAESKLEPLESRFHNDVLARYLSLLLFREEGDFDGARIDSEKIDDAFVQQTQLYEFEKPPLPVLEYSEDTAQMNFVAFTGRSPAKLAHTIFIDSGNSVVRLTYQGEGEDYVNRLIGFNTIFMPGVRPGFHFKFELPYLSLRGSDITSIAVLIDGVEAGQLYLTENMERIAEETFKLKQPLIVGKTVTRTVTKGILKEVGKDVANDQLGFFGGLLVGIAADVAVDATENADTRLSQFFPAHAYTGEIGVTPGLHDIQLVYYSNGMEVFRDYKGMVDVQSQSLNLIQSFVFQ